MRRGHFDLVLLAAATIGGDALANEIRHLPDTRFVFIGAEIGGTPFAGQPNVTAVTFADEQAGYLAGDPERPRRSQPAAAERQARDLSNRRNGGGAVGQGPRGRILTWGA